MTEPMGFEEFCKWIDEMGGRVMIKIVGYLVIDVANTIFCGFVLSELWSWFVVPFGVMQISVAWGVGICTVASLLSTPILQDADKINELIVLRFARTTISYLFGYVALQFI